MVQNWDECGATMPCARTRIAWEIGMAGAYQTTGERAGQGTGAGADTGGGWINGRGDSTMILLKYHAILHDVFTAVSWWRMTPRPELTHHGTLCLTAPDNRQYLLYVQSGTPTLITPKQIYGVRAVDIWTGISRDLPDLGVVSGLARRIWGLVWQWFLRRKNKSGLPLVFVDINFTSLPMQLPFVLAILSTFFLVAGIVYFGRRKPGYSQFQHTISELGEIGSADARLVGYGLFLSVGLLLIGLAALSNGQPLRGLAACVGIGYIVAAFFPCDVGSPSSGSGRQQIHNLGGAVEYIGGAYFITQFVDSQCGLQSDMVNAGAAAIFLGAILLSVAQLPLRGLLQRIIESILFGFLLYGTACVSNG